MGISTTLSPAASSFFVSWPTVMVVSTPSVASTLFGGSTLVLSTVGGGGVCEQPATISAEQNARTTAATAIVRDLMCVSPVGVPDPLR